MREPKEIAALIAEIREKCDGRDRWYVMNANEDGYCMDFNFGFDADNWVTDMTASYPGYMKQNGYHVVKQRSFGALESLANEAAASLDRLTQSHAALLAALEKVSANDCLLTGEFRAEMAAAIKTAKELGC